MGLIAHGINPFRAAITHVLGRQITWDLELIHPQNGSVIVRYCTFFTYCLFIVRYILYLFIVYCKVAFYLFIAYLRVPFQLFIAVFLPIHL